MPVDNEEYKDEDDIEEACPPPSELVKMCEQLERACIIHSEADGVSALVMQQQLRRLRGHLRRVDLASKKQATLLDCWAVKLPGPQIFP
jgi:hypothetical protein